MNLVPAKALPAKAAYFKVMTNNILISHSFYLQDHFLKEGSTY